MDPRALRGCVLFEGLPEEKLEKVAAIAEHRDLAAGERLFGQGEKGDAVYIVVAGKVRISRQVRGAGEEALAVLGPGDFFGEMALFDQIPRSADAIAHTACALARIRREALEALMFTDRDLAHDLLWIFVRTLARRLRETNDRYEVLLTMNALPFR